MANLAAIYARVSTHEQTTENQITELEALAAQRGLTIIRSYEDKGYSGKTDKRPEFQAMMKDALAGRFNVLLCWHIDRLGRSLVDVVNNVQTIQASNVELILQQQSIDTTTPVGKAMISREPNMPRCHTSLSPTVKCFLMLAQPCGCIFFGN